MPRKKRKKTNSAVLKEQLNLRLRKSKKQFKSNHPHAYKFFTNNEVDIGSIRDHARKLAASSAVAGSLMLASPALSQLQVPDTVKHAQLSQYEREILLSREIIKQLPESRYALTPEQEGHISELIKDYWDVDAYPVLDSKRLNHSYGLMGGEQHLPRYPGDNVYQHDELQKAGITPARGAWGYLVKSKNEMTKDIVLREKYYVAVQTLYLPDWNSNWAELKEWYKFRKVIVINPRNGKTVVADIADAGPANWTGKHFGGSPELMQHLDLYKGMMKGEVILYFVYDPEGEIPLGPVTYN